MKPESGICCNTLMELQASDSGLPVAFIVRGILSKRNGQDALFFIKNIPNASGQNYIIGTQDSVCDFESSPQVKLFNFFLTKPGKI